MPRLRPSTRILAADDTNPGGYGQTLVYGWSHIADYFFHTVEKKAS